MGKLTPTGKDSFTITYGGLESPIAGIDASKVTPIFINPSALAGASGLIAQDGYLSSAFLNPINSIAYGNLINAGQPYVVGDVQLSSTTESEPFTITKYSYGFIAISTSTQLIVYEFANGFVAPSTNNISISANQASTLTFYIVQGIVYITGLGFGAIYAYTPIVGGGSTLTQLTNYVGGAYLGELNGRLIVLCADQIVSGVYTYQPGYIYWSAAIGAYGTWNPLVGGLVTGAGFSQLPDVADEIAGFFAVGPTGYIIRKQGISEMTPLNSGIEPFDFNHMWASRKGIGSTYINTIAQYGSLGGFLSDTGLYTMGFGGINTIQGSFWGAIVEQLTKFLPAYSYGSLGGLLKYINGTIVPVTIANETYLSYILYIPGVDTSSSVLFVGNILTQDWNVIECFSWAETAFNIVKIQGVSNTAIFANGGDATVALISAVSSTGHLILYTINDLLTRPSTIAPIIPFPGLPPSCSFPIEQGPAMFKDITVNAIGVYLDATVSGGDNIELTFAVNTVVYTALFGTGNGQLLIAYPKTTPFTGQYPQLSLQTELGASNTSGLRIYTIVMFCTFDVNQKP